MREVDRLGPRALSKRRVVYGAVRKPFAVSPILASHSHPADHGQGSRPSRRLSRHGCSRPLHGEDVAGRPPRMVTRRRAFLPVRTYVAARVPRCRASGAHRTPTNGQIEESAPVPGLGVVREFAGTPARAGHRCAVNGAAPRMSTGSASAPAEGRPKGPLDMRGRGVSRNRRPSGAAARARGCGRAHAVDAGRGGAGSGGPPARDSGASRHPSGSRQRGGPRVNSEPEGRVTPRAGTRHPRAAASR